MRFLITGGAGFIGTTLANHLVRTGHHVRVLDDLSAGDPSRLDARVLFSRGDVRNVPNLWTLLQDVECVYHLAARISVPESVLYPLEYNDVNVGGTVALLTAVRDVGVPRVVLTSSASVYGNQPGQPVHETMQPSPKSPYAITKIAAEHYLFMLGRLYNCDAVALRVFNAYGPGQRIPPAHAPVVPLFLRRALTGGSLVVHGNGSQTRDFVHIDDVLDLTLLAMDKISDGRAINIGMGKLTSFLELIEVFTGFAGYKPTIKPLLDKPVGVHSRYCDMTWVEENLGWKAKISIEEGMRRVYEAALKKI